MTWRGLFPSSPNSHLAKRLHGLPSKAPPEPSESLQPVEEAGTAASRARAAIIACSRRTPATTVPRTTGRPPCFSSVEWVRPALPTPVETPQSDVKTIVTWPSGSSVISKLLRQGTGWNADRRWAVGPPVRQMCWSHPLRGRSRGERNRTGRTRPEGSQLNPRCPGAI